MVSSPTTPATTNRPTASPNQWLVANKPVAVPHLKIPRPVAVPRLKWSAEIPRPVAVPRLKWSAEIPKPVAVPRLKVPRPVLCPTEANLNPQLTRWNQRMQRQQQDQYLQEVSWLGSAWELMQQQNINGTNCDQRKPECCRRVWSWPMTPFTDGKKVWDQAWTIDRRGADQDTPG